MKKPNFCLNIPLEKIADKVLLVQDNESCTHVAETFFKDYEKFNSNKNFFGYTGTYLGKPLTVLNVGMGSFGVAAAAEELFAAHVASIVYLGQCDSLTEEIKPRQYVVLSSAVNRADGKTEHASAYVKDRIQSDFRSRKNLTITPFEDSTLHENCVAVSVSDRPLPKIAPDDLKGAFDVADQGSYALFSAARQAGKDAASILLIDRNLVTGEEMLDKEFQRCTMRQIVLAMANV